MALDLPIIVGNSSGNEAFSGVTDPPSTVPFDYNGVPTTPQNQDTWVNRANSDFPIWEYTPSGWVFRGNLKGATGPAGTSVSSASIESGNLVLQLTDGSQVNAGSVVGPQGPQGPIGVGLMSGAITNGQLVFTLSNGSTLTVSGSVVGPKGDKGDTGSSGPVGAKGDTGATGSVGPQGNPGTPADPAVTNALAARITALEAQKLQIEFRDAIPIPATVVVLGTATVDVPVTWPTPFPDTNYTIVPPQVTALNISVLGRAQAVVKPGTKTAAGVTVTVTTTGTLAVGTSTFSILAYRRGP